MLEEIGCNTFYSISILYEPIAKLFLGLQHSILDETRREVSNLIEDSFNLMAPSTHRNAVGLKAVDHSSISNHCPVSIYFMSNVNFLP